MTAPRRPAQIEVKFFFMAGAEEIVENPQALGSVQRRERGRELGKARLQLCADAGEIRPRFLDVLLLYRNCQQLVLGDVVAGAGRQITDKAVPLLAVGIQRILLHGHHNGLLIVGPIHAAVVDGQFDLRTHIQGIDYGTPLQEHFHLVILAGDAVIDVAEAIGLGEAIPIKKDAVRINTLNRHPLLYGFRNGIMLGVLLTEHPVQFQ